MDHISSAQGMFAKMFNDGTVVINTTGSSMPEMVLSNLKEYRRFFELINKGYKAHRR
jgi:hypothetical protein